MAENTSFSIGSKCNAFALRQHVDSGKCSTTDYGAIPEEENIGNYYLY
jgi:hypothetical protein